MTEKAIATRRIYQAYEQQDEIFSALNGLFLHKEIKEALEKGVIITIPDIDLEPQEIRNLSKDIKEQKQRVRD